MRPSGGYVAPVGNSYALGTTITPPVRRSSGSGMSMPQLRSLTGAPQQSHVAHLQSSAVEALQEDQFKQQVMSLKHIEPPRPPEVTNLPGGGRYDHLLQRGRSLELYRTLPTIFREDAPPDSGRTNGHSAGKGCHYGQAYRTEVFSEGAVFSLLNEALTMGEKGLWDRSVEGNIVTLQPSKRLYIVGDTHGQLEDVLWMFFKYGPPSKDNQYLFNGDIVDRGSHSLEILLLLLAFKRDCPDSVHINRGNHEDTAVCSTYGFYSEMYSKYPNSGGQLLNYWVRDFFPLLSLGAIVKTEQIGDFFVAHGGLPIFSPQDMQTLPIEELKTIDRTAFRSTAGPQDPPSHALFNLLWGDPTEDATQRGVVGCRGRGAKFTEGDARTFCNQNNVQALIRSHEVPRNRRGVLQDNAYCYTVFSASNYTGNQGNWGGVVVFTPDNLFYMEHWAPTFKFLEACMLEPQEKHFETATTFEATRGEQMIPGMSNRNGSESAPQTQEQRTRGLSNGSQPSVERSSSADNRAQNSDVSGDVLKRASEQVQQFIMELITLHEGNLFQAFLEADQNRDGTLALATWATVMQQVLGDSCAKLGGQEKLRELAHTWNLGEQVEYIEFLHRFRIDAGGFNLERKTILECIRIGMLNIPVGTLQSLLDPNSDGIVSKDDFSKFLQKVNAQVSIGMQGVFYDTMCNLSQETHLSTDNALLCLAVIQARIRPPSDLADHVSRACRQTNKTLAQLFREWDANDSGFVSMQELKDGLLTLAQVTDEHVQALMEYIEQAGIKNNRIDILEFVGALAPRTFSIHLNFELSKELLRNVWARRDYLNLVLQQYDSGLTSKVTSAQFSEGMKAMNEKLKEMKEPSLLTESEIYFVCEQASRGSNEVNYQAFLKILRVIDGLSTIEHYRNRGNELHAQKVAAVAAR